MPTPAVTRQHCDPVVRGDTRIIELECLTRTGPTAPWTPVDFAGCALTFVLRKEGEGSVLVTGSASTPEAGTLAYKLTAQESAALAADTYVACFRSEKNGERETWPPEGSFFVPVVDAL